MPRKLNVYRTHIGFDDLIVAAPSKKAALEAWGASPHLFAQGFAAITDEAALVKAALAGPGIVLRRQFGTNGEFKAEASSLRLPPAPPRASGKRTQSKSSRAPAKPTAADRAAEKRVERERNAAERAARRAEARRREQKTRDAAAAERRELQSELEELTTERWRRLSEIKQKEETLARERREIEQAFETRMTALRKQLKKI